MNFRVVFSVFIKNNIVIKMGTALNLQYSQSFSSPELRGLPIFSCLFSFYAHCFKFFLVEAFQVLDSFISRNFMLKYKQFSWYTSQEDDYWYRKTIFNVDCFVFYYFAEVVWSCDQQRTGFGFPASRWWLTAIHVLSSGGTNSHVHGTKQSFHEHKVK